MLLGKDRVRFGQRIQATLTLSPRTQRSGPASAKSERHQESVHTASLLGAVETRRRAMQGDPVNRGSPGLGRGDFSTDKMQDNKTQRVRNVGLLEGRDCIFCL